MNPNELFTCVVVGLLQMLKSLHITRYIFAMCFYSPGWFLRATGACWIPRWMQKYSQLVQIVLLLGGWGGPVPSHKLIKKRSLGKAGVASNLTPPHGFLITGWSSSLPTWLSFLATGWRAAFQLARSPCPPTLSLACDKNLSPFLPFLPPGSLAANRLRAANLHLVTVSLPTAPLTFPNLSHFCLSEWLLGWDQVAPWPTCPASPIFCLFESCRGMVEKTQFFTPREFCIDRKI